MGGSGRRPPRGGDVTNSLGRPGEPWHRDEVNVVVTAYLAMLSAELRGERPNKSARIAEIAPLLPARSISSIERKMQNISAVLAELQLEWIDGYKPLAHYQLALRDAVADALSGNRRIAETMSEYRDNSLPAPKLTQAATDDVLVAPPS